jgi:hypothetical protein
MRIELAAQTQAVYPESKKIAIATENQKKIPLSDKVVISSAAKNNLIASQQSNGGESDLKAKSSDFAATHSINTNFSNASVDDYTSEYAKVIGTSEMSVLIPKDKFEAYIKSERDRIDTTGVLETPEMIELRQSKADILSKRKALYEQLVSQGKTPVEIVKSITEFNIKLPISYGDSLDVTKSHSSGYYRSMQQLTLDRVNAGQRNFSSVKLNRR